jgi:hypothetical protein
LLSYAGIYVLIGFLLPSELVVRRIAESSKGLLLGAAVLINLAAAVLKAING